MLSEHLRVQNQRSRARCLGAPATLTCEQWEQTLTDFNGQCAYCLERSFDVLEHFEPVALAGTTVKNCIPACYECNHKKRDYRGESLHSLFEPSTIKRIQDYLANRSTTLPDHPAKYQRQTRVLQDKATYIIQELIDCLPCKLAHLSKQSSIGDETIRYICKGRAARIDTANKLLSTLAVIYNRPLSLKNVTGIKLCKPLRDVHQQQNIHGTQRKRNYH